MCLGAFVLTAILYSPVLRAPFMFDDLGLPFQLSIAQAPLGNWLKSPRPALMFSYWLNYQQSGGDSFSYHLVNLLIHSINGTLVFLALARLLGMAGWARRQAAAGAILGAALFLIHPLATESVSYTAGRSESFAAMWVMAAYVIFLYRREEGIRWRDSIAIVVLFALGAASKENAVALAGVLALTDWLWTPRRTWRLWALILPGAALAVLAAIPVMFHGGNAGFSIKEFTWYQYTFTQARAILTYVRLALFPFGQSVDHDFPISHSLMEYGAWAYGLAICVLTAAAIFYRRQYRLASFGWLMFLIWLAPTSSILPIADALVERRMYLPMLGLILIACEAASRVKISTPLACGAIAAALIFYGALTLDRNRLWQRPEALLESAALLAEHNPRPVANLTDTLIAERRCDEILPWLERAERTMAGNYVIEASWGRALECVGRREEALVRLRRAAALHPSSKIFEWIGLVNGEMNRLDDAGTALRHAVTLDPNAASARRSLALWHEAMRDNSSAEREYRAALAIDPYDNAAAEGLARVTAARASGSE